MESDPEQHAPSGAPFFPRRTRLWVAAISEALDTSAFRSRLSMARLSPRTKTVSLDGESSGQELPEEGPAHSPAVQHKRAQRLAAKYPAPPDDDALLQLCDDVRASLWEDKELGIKRDELVQVLDTAVKSEGDGVPTISLRTISKARLDKLLCDILNPEFHPDSITMEFRADRYVAMSLQRQWRARFREAYFELDHERYLGLTGKGGKLDNMMFSRAYRAGHNFWNAHRTEKLSECEGNTEFREGHWWVDLACAHRDGILCSSRDTLSKSEYDIPSLPLMTGSEIAHWPYAEVRYVREGTMADMCLPLMTHVGGRVRILRGHLLKSPFAPKVGVRYDGQYILRQYGQKENTQTGIFRLSLVLERAEGQRPMHYLARIPRPSQVDDWQLFERLEGEMVRSQFGDGRFLEWKMTRAQARMDKEQLERIINFESTTAMEKWVETAKKDGRDATELESIRNLSDLRWER